MNAFWASENLLAFIVFRSSQPSDHAAENSSFKWSSFLGSDHKGKHEGDPVDVAPTFLSSSEFALTVGIALLGE
jgi:hypothetical protein